MDFTGKSNDPSIEEYIHRKKSSWKGNWVYWLPYGLREDATRSWMFLNYDKMELNLSNEAYEHVFLYGRSHAMNKDKESTKVLFSSDNSLL
jgi:hypothetical protein